MICVDTFIKKQIDIYFLISDWLANFSNSDSEIQKQKPSRKVKLQFIKN